MDIMSALRHMAETIKQYIDGGFVAFIKPQSLTSPQRLQAKKNIGIHIGPDMPTNAVDGDIWFDTSDATPGPVDEAEVIRALEELDEIIGGMSE